MDEEVSEVEEVDEEVSEVEDVVMGAGRTGPYGTPLVGSYGAEVLSEKNMVDPDFEASAVHAKRRSKDGAEPRTIVNEVSDT